MRTAMFLQQTSNLFLENRLLKFVIVLLTLAVGVNSFLVFKSISYQRVILIPAGLREPIEFVAGRPSDQYLREMARFVTGLAATFSPATVRNQFNELLALHAPAAYPQAAKTWYTLAGQVEQTHVSHVFDLRAIRLDNAGNRIEITGEQKEFADDRLIETRQRTFVIRYQLTDGSYFLLSFLEKGQDQDLPQPKSENQDD